MLLARASYHELFMLALGLAVAGFVLCLTIRDPGTFGSTGRSTAHEGPLAVPRSVLSTGAQRNLMTVWIAAFAFFVGVTALFTFMKTFVAAVAAGSVGTFFGTYAGIAVALRIGAGRLPDRVGARRMLGLAMSLYAVGLVVLSAAQTTAVIIAAGLLCGAGHAFAFPVLFSLVIERARPQERGAAAAFFTGLDWLALFVAGPLVGAVIERAGYSTTFAGLAVVLWAGVATFYALDHRRSLATP
jgi:predicted MFS family arabinose efflux permease